MINNKVKKLAAFFLSNKKTIATAESCTGGLLSSLLTDISGSSNFVKLNFVTYANEAKKEILKVPDEILETKGAVSEECAFYMAKGLKERTNCDIAICTTGIAGPTGGTKEKPVGLLYVGVYFNEKIYVKKYLLPKFIPRKLMKKIFVSKAISFLFSIIY